MYKEAVICVITVIAIIILNILTGNYTKESVSELSSELYKLREELSEENIEDEEIQKKADYIYDKWNKRYNVLAYYLEHDELEKVGNSIISLRSAINTNEYPEAISELDESVFVLKHIQEKNSFDMKNIF